MARSKILLIPLIFIFPFLALFGPFANAQSIAINPWQEKVDATLLAQYTKRTADQPLDFIVRLEEQAVIDVPAEFSHSKTARGEYVYHQLHETAQKSQAPLVQLLKAAGANTQPFIIINALHVTAPASLLPQIASRADVAHVHANLAVQFDVQEKMTFPFAETQAPTGVAWGIEKIGAPLLWADGVTGAGAVIAGQDTGYNWEHPALINSYRGWDGSTADHNYNWHDAISVDLSGNNSNLRCGFNLAVPCDDISSTHGTHTMGTMTGLDGDNQIGAAPDAKWIGCRNMEEGYGTPTTYINCFEWFLSPTDLANQNPDPAKAPHVINNSWGCPPSEGCNLGNFEMMNIVINNLRAAGIVVVASAGNSGSSCGSVSTPAAIFDGAFTIGASDSNDNIASFSSRGPVSADGSGRMKPNVTAPGVSVFSASQFNSYASNSGTSMAGPHVAGAIGLIISAYPPIAGNVEAIETYLEETADYIGIGSCGGTELFNNTYGHGRINVNSAVRAIWDLDLHKSIPTAGTVSPTNNTSPSTILTYTLSLTKTGPMITFTNTTVTDTLPIGASLISTSVPISPTSSGYVWQVGDLSAGEAASLTVAIQITKSTAITFPAATATADNIPTTATPILYFAPYRQWLPFIGSHASS